MSTRSLNLLTTSFGTSLGLAGLLFVSAGCRETGGNGGILTNDLAMSGSTDLAGVDLSGVVPRDMAISGPRDLAMAAAVPVDDLYTGSAMYENKFVAIKDVVVTGLVRGLGPAKNSMKCRYEAYVQAPSGAGHTGVRLFASGDVCTPTDGGFCSCPFAPNTNTPLDAIEGVGDVVGASGFWGAYTPPDAPTQHELEVKVLARTGTGGVITPMVITDLAGFQLNGGGWVGMESMLVTIKPAQATALSAADQYGNWTYAGVPFTDGYNYYYNRADGGVWPTPRGTYTQITGIATLPFGGSVYPRLFSDFTP